MNVLANENPPSLTHISHDFLSMNLLCRCDLILDENLCDYHLKFMFHRRQLVAIQSDSLMGKFQATHKCQYRSVFIPTKELH